MIDYDIVRRAEEYYNRTGSKPICNTFKYGKDCCPMTAINEGQPTSVEQFARVVNKSPVWVNSFIQGFDMVETTLCESDPFFDQDGWDTGQYAKEKLKPYTPSVKNYPYYS